MAQRQDLILDQGSRFQWVYEVIGLSLAGKSVRMQIRKLAGADLYLDATSYVSVDSINGHVVVDIPANATVGSTWSKGVYDIEIFDPAQPTTSPIRIVQGDVALDREVTV